MFALVERWFYLHNRSFEVVFDSDGSTEDLEAIEQSLIDVLVLDQRLASGSGVSFYSSLRNLTGVKQAPQSDFNYILCPTRTSA
jgi:DNA-binding response OmpR family regulator